jgi:adenylate cyclase
MEFIVPSISLHSPQGKIVSGAAIGLLVWLVVMVLCRGQLLEPFELKTYDQLCQLNATSSSSPEEIALVVIDQGSLEAALEQGITWPWPRQMYAPIVHFCTSSGARAVVFDILYTEPSVYGVEDDHLLAEALQESTVVLLPLFLSSTDRTQQDWEASSSSPPKGRWQAMGFAQRELPNER